MKKVKVLSLFSGAGGLDLGFHLEGFDIKACIELEKDACDTLELNKDKYLSKDTKIYCHDITKLPPESVKNEIGNVDFMIGGPPCQSFSAAGRRAGGVPGINDTRGSLFWYYAQYLRTFKPKGFLFENVKGILQANKSQDWEIIKESFRELGYKLTYRILDAADYGTPQHRERVILVGQLLETPFKFPKPVFGR
ncbi:MAG: DNA cytosine methyltransferase, partial [Ghiorsea sp.]|nr:DNA cytosine methyltransferase [Ghiorsea sp.]